MEEKNQESCEREEMTAQTEKNEKSCKSDNKSDKKKEEKQLKEENKALSAELAEKTSALKKAEESLAETMDKYQRVCAEYENFRRRSQKEREGIYADAYSDALHELLPVIDNLELAAKYTDPEKVSEGIALIFKSVEESLKKLGIESFGAAGETFDPNIHNAVMHSEEEGKGEGEITDVFQKGYKKGDKIIRHAMVKVVN